MEASELIKYMIGSLEYYNHSAPMTWGAFSDFLDDFQHKIKLLETKEKALHNRD